MLKSNISSHNYTPEEIQHYLSQLQHQSTLAFIPALVYLCLLIVVGSVGNCLVLVVYSSKLTRTPLRIFIISMAIFDLPTNLLVIPGEIYDMLHVWDFDMPNVCKIRRYLNAAMVLSSGFVLVAIATTRYKMVCSPLGEQVTVTQAKFTSGFIVAISCIIALLYGIIHGTQTIRTPNPDITGRFCEVDDSYVKTIWPNVNSAFFILIFVACCLTMTVFYLCIGHKTWKLSQKRKSLMQLNSVSKFKKSSVALSPVLHRKKAYCSIEATRKKSCPGEQTITSSETECADLIHSNNSEAISASSLSYYSRRKISDQQGSINSFDLFTSASNDYQGSFRINDIKGRRSFFGKTSMTMFTVSLAFILGFVPFLALNFYKTALPESYAALEGVPLAVYHLLLRSYLVNCAINPIVYSLLDQKFKRTCAQLLRC